MPWLVCPGREAGSVQRQVLPDRWTEPSPSKPAPDWRAGADWPVKAVLPAGPGWQAEPAPQSPRDSGPGVGERSSRPPASLWEAAPRQRAFSPGSPGGYSRHIPKISPKLNLLSSDIGNPSQDQEPSRCRRASYRRMAAAALAFRELSLPFMGMWTSTSQVSATRRLIPSPSEPMTMAAGPFRSAS